MDPFRNGAAGVVSSAKLFRPEDSAELTTITASRCRARASRPSAALSVASQLSVDAAATPPLRGGEYGSAEPKLSVTTAQTQNKNFTDICSCRGLNIVLGIPKRGFGTGGPAAGQPPT